MNSKLLKKKKKHSKFWKQIFSSNGWKNKHLLIVWIPSFLKSLLMDMEMILRRIAQNGGLGGTITREGGIF